MVLTVDGEHSFTPLPRAIRCDGVTHELAHASLHVVPTSEAGAHATRRRQTARFPVLLILGKRVLLNIVMEELQHSHQRWGNRVDWFQAIVDVRQGVTAVA